MGLSFSQTTNDQYAQSDITQQYSGTCNMECTNKISGVNINITNSNVRDVDITQSCAVNGTCMFNTSSDATSDVFFKAKDSSSAGAAGSELDPGAQFSISTSRQDIRQKINQLINQTCTIQSTNEIDNVNIYVEGSNVSKGINISQNGKVGGQCQLTATLNAAATASGSSTSCSASGKKTKKCGGSSTLMNIIIIGIVFSFLSGLVILLSKFFTNSNLCPPGNETVTKTIIGPNGKPLTQTTCIQLPPSATPSTSTKTSGTQPISVSKPSISSKIVSPNISAVNTASKILTSATK